LFLYQDLIITCCGDDRSVAQHGVIEGFRVQGRGNVGVGKIITVQQAQEVFEMAE